MLNNKVVRVNSNSLVAYNHFTDISKMIDYIKRIKHNCPNDTLIVIDGNTHQCGLI